MPDLLGIRKARILTARMRQLTLPLSGYTLSTLDMQSLQHVNTRLINQKSLLLVKRMLYALLSACASCRLLLPFNSSLQPLALPDSILHISKLRGKDVK